VRLRLPGIQQDAACVGVLTNPRLQVYSRLHRDGLDEWQAKTAAVRIDLVAMELQQPQWNIIEYSPYRGRRGIDEQADQRNEWRDGRRYSAGLFQRHVPRTAFEEDQAERVDATFNGGASILDTGNSTDFNAGAHGQAIDECSRVVAGQTASVTETR
jgi:hypothetical protein